jgi:hypothetical protein
MPSRIAAPVRPAPAEILGKKTEFMDFRREDNDEELL